MTYMVWGNNSTSSIQTLWYVLVTEMFNNFIQKTKVYTFLDGLDDRLHIIRAQVMQLSPSLSIEQAFAHVRQEANR